MINNQWYAILPSKVVKQGEILGVKRLDLNLALFRDRTGQVVCVKDQCTHRGVALSVGKYKDGCVECPFHGLRFSSEGVCTLAPSLGKSTKADLSRYNVKHYPTREELGIIFVWYGEGEPTTPLPLMPEEVDEKMTYSEIEDHWNAFYSRCIENQLDVIHLPFVHHNTIGRGNKTVVNGPKVVFENTSLQTSANNSVDEGQAPKPASECVIKSTYLRFRFPNVWVNHISNDMKIFIYFAPVDQENTILYIRFYSSISSLMPINKMIAFFGKFGNRIVERQDKRVVITQRPFSSSYLSDEKLFPGDRPVIEYRRIRDALKKEISLEDAFQEKKTSP